jgi:hypothetical protein
MRRSSVAVLFALVGSTAAPAAAQPGGQFMTLDRGDHKSRAGVFLALLHAEDTGLDEGAIRLELHGQLIGARGVGGYASVPIHHLLVPETEDETVLGGVEVGGLLTDRLAGGQEMVLRAGLVLPTAEGGSSPEVFANVTGGFNRLTDYTQSLPETSSLRLSGSLLGSAPGLFYRLDGGLDFPLATLVEDADLQHDPLVRLNGALGVGLGPADLAFEVVNVIVTAGDDLSLSERALTNAGVALGQGVGGLHLQGGFFVSVDSVLEEDSDVGFITFALAASSAW